MSLAASGLNIEVIIYIAAAVWGVISWFRGKNAPPQEEDGEPQHNDPPQGRPRPIQQGESEQERLRRFLEALGVPAGQAPPPRPQPQPPVYEPSPVVRPAPEPRPIPQPVFQEQEEMPLAGRLEEPAAAMESIGTQFDQMASGVVLPPVAELLTREDVVALDAVAAHEEVTGTAIQRPDAVTAKAVKALLASPESIRTAFVLSEILGPPKSATV